MKKINFILIVFIGSLLFQGVAFGQDLTKFYYYSESNGVYKVTLQSAFRTQLNKADGGSLSDGSGYTWRTGDPLPNPAPNGMYNGKKVTSISGLFYECENMSSIDLSKYNTSNVVDMSNLFTYCTSLKSINFDRFDMSNVEYADAMFFGCSSLTSLDMGTMGSYQRIYMNNMFKGCSSLEFLDISNFSKTSILQCENAFVDCGVAPVFPSTERTQVIAFDRKTADFLTGSNAGCDLTKLSFIVVDLTKFYTYTDVPGGVKVALTDAFKASLNTISSSFSDGSGFVWRSGKPLPNPARAGLYGIKSVVSMKGMFEGCDKVSSLDLRKFNTSNVADMSDMFKRCTGLTYLVLKFNTKNVTTMACMFFECTKIFSLDLSTFNTSMLTDMGSMFSGCSMLRSVNLSSFNTSNVISMGGMFNSCTYLDNIDLSNFDTSKVTYLNNMFTSCTSLISANLSSFNGTAVKDIAHMFNGCSSLTSLDLSNFSVAQTIRCNGAFYDCGKAEDGVAASGLVKDDATAAFFNTTAKTTIDNSRLLFTKKVNVDVNVTPLDGRNIKIYSSIGTLYVSGLIGGNTLSIYRVSGELLSTITCAATEYNTVLDPGVYIVKIDDRSEKVVVL